MVKLQFSNTCRVLPLKKEAQEKDQAMRAAAASNFKSMLRDRGDITASSRWSKVGSYNDMMYNFLLNWHYDMIYILGNTLIETMYIPLNKGMINKKYIASKKERVSIINIRKSSKEINRLWYPHF